MVTVGMSPKFSTTWAHLLQSGYLALPSASLALDDRSGVGETGAALRPFPADVGDQRLGHLALLDQVGHLFLLAGADLPEHHDGLCVRVVLEEAYDLGQRQAHNGVPAYVYQRRRADALLCQVVGHGGGDAAAAGADAHRPLEKPLAGAGGPASHHPQHRLVWA